MIPRFAQGPSLPTWNFDSKTVAKHNSLKSLASNDQLALNLNSKKKGRCSRQIRRRVWILLRSISWTNIWTWTLKRKVEKLTPSHLSNLVGIRS
jgi:hypothetical protein